MASRHTTSIPSGTIRGELGSKGRIVHYRGIPYAAPPVDDRRWKPPAPVEPWRGTRKCTSYSPSAYQRGIGMPRVVDNLVDGLGVGVVRRRALKAGIKLGAGKQSEDCLYLNVHAPAYATELDQPAPVMVWIHGGDHTDGAGSEPMYNTDAFCERGAVLVTINYRLGMFGFFAHPDLASESDQNVSGNYGLLDQIAALEWVRDNISHFGGDADNVTIFGESAGGEAVLNLMTAPTARGLFHRAIAQSPSDSGRWLHLRRPALDFQPAEQAGIEFANNVVGEANGQIDRLRSMAAEELNVYYHTHERLGDHFYPAVDGVILPTTPMSAFGAGLQAPVPLMIGYNSDEASLFMDVVHPAGAEFKRLVTEGSVEPIGRDEARAAFERSYPSTADVDRLMAAYPGLDHLDDQAVAREVSDHMFGVHVEYASRHHAKAGHPVYRYFFTATPPSKKQTIGAFHAAEIFYVFDSSFPLVPVAPDAHLTAREMGDRWFAFATSGVPDSPGRVSWPAYTAESPQQMVFSRPNSVIADVPPSPGLDLMCERVDWLTASLS